MIECLERNFEDALYLSRVAGTPGAWAVCKLDEHTIGVWHRDALDPSIGLDAGELARIRRPGLERLEALRPDQKIARQNLTLAAILSSELIIGISVYFGQKAAESAARRILVAGRMLLGDGSVTDLATLLASPDPGDWELGLTWMGDPRFRSETQHKS